MDARPTGHTSRLVVLAVSLCPLVAMACTAAPKEDGRTASAPSGPVAAVCDRVQPGPASAPAGAVTVDAGVDRDLTVKTETSPPGTTFWLAPGEHTIGWDQYGQVAPKDGNRYIGAPGAILDGRKHNMYAFVAKAPNVTISHLTIRGFVPPAHEGVVNHDSGNGWVIEHNTIEDNRGAGLMAGAHQRVRGNCVRNNGQYGMNAYQRDNGIVDLLIEGNEIVGNNTDNWESKVEGCGCTGGIKLWSVNGADIRGNWIHDNRGPGLWADTNNNDFLIEGNLIEGNDSAAVFYETSYNAVIRNNTLRRNNWVVGRGFADRGDSFPAAAVYLSESGGEPRVPARTDKIDVYGNVFEDNWSGITAWENADRFCNSPANSSTGTCTLLVPDVSACAQPAISADPLYGDCRWKTQRLDIHHNQFKLDPGVVKCRALCARMAILANFGTYPDWSPYAGEAVRQAITFDQDNWWHDNAYVGPWTFMPYDTSRMFDSAQWQSAPYRQDKGSTYSAVSGG